MLNLKGQQDKTRSNNDRFDATGHQDMLKQAFSTVLADQIMEGQAEDRAAAYKRAMQIQDAEERQFEEATQRPKGSDDDEESSDIDFDDMDAELDKIQATRRAEVCFSLNKISLYLFFFIPFFYCYTITLIFSFPLLFIYYLFESQFFSFMYYVAPR